MVHRMLLELCSEVGGHSYDALPSARIRQLGSILPWASPHVPCHTLGSIRDHYDLDLACTYPMPHWLPTFYWLCYRCPVVCMFKNALRGINVKP